MNVMITLRLIKISSHFTYRKQTPFRNTETTSYGVIKPVSPDVTTTISFYPFSSSQFPF